MKRPASSTSGFTLVEMAIVLMIIGLLIGGIIRGAELIHQARLKATMKDVLGFTGAMHMFTDRYGAMPGDFPLARLRIAGCTAANYCENGNGNGVIGEPIFFWIWGDQDVEMESAQFWKHLALTRMLGRINPQASDFEWGQTHPTAPVGGGFSVVTSATGGEGSFPTGTLVVRVHGDNGPTDRIIELNPVLSPQDAGYIDRKMDDGIPLTGNVRTKAMGNGAVVAACEATYTSDDFLQCVQGYVLNL